MIAPQFQVVGSTDNITRNISDIGTLNEGMAGYDADYVYATELRVWDPTTFIYTVYGWSGTSGTAVDDDPSYDNQWLDQSTEKTDDTIDLGHGVWIYAEKPGTMTISGQVMDKPLVVNLVQGYNMIANPYPMDVPIANFGKLDSAMSGYDSDYVYATELRVWNPSTFIYTVYGWSGTSGTAVDDDPSYDNQWLDQSTEKTTDVIPAGSAVWIYAEKAGTITFEPSF